MLYYLRKALLATTVGVLGAAWATTPQASWHWALVAEVAAVLALVLGLLVGPVQLRTQLDADGVRLWYSPFQKGWQFIPWSHIRRAYVRTYSPVGEFGGWGGIRKFSSENVAYNVWGTKGMQLVLTSGDSLLVGTQRPAEIQEVLQHLKIAGPRSPFNP